VRLVSIQVYKLERKKKDYVTEKKMTGEIGAEAREGLVGLVMMM
jgi:hypothetical protein